MELLSNLSNITTANTNPNITTAANDLLQQQQYSNEKLNALLEQYLSANSCGPDCQKNT